MDRGGLGHPEPMRSASPAVRLDEPDHGLFGPDSVTWQVHGDPAMWVAGIRSLYLQALHPLAVAAVVQNSDFRAAPLGRLIRTADFVGVSTYGTHEEVERASARVRRVHRQGRFAGLTVVTGVWMLVLGWRVGRGVVLADLGLNCWIAMNTVWLVADLNSQSPPLVFAVPLAILGAGFLAAATWRSQDYRRLRIRGR